MGRGGVNRACTATHVDTYARRSHGHNAKQHKRRWSHDAQNRTDLIIRTGSSVIQSHHEEVSDCVCFFWKKKKTRLHPDPGGITCFTGQPAVQQRFPFVPFPSLRLRHRQRPDAEHGRRTISAPASVNASGRRTAATSPSEYKLALIPKGVELKGESLKLPC